MRNLLLFAGVVITATAAALYVHVIQPAEAQQNCDPAYPTVCIPPPPPDLDCKDIQYRNFPVRRRSDPSEPDPHRFDSDNDGIGCEPPPRQ